MSTREEHATEQRVCQWLADQREAMIALLADLVNIDSASYHRTGIGVTG